MNTLYKEEINASFRLLVNKQLPLLKESGFGNYVSLVMCPTCQKLSSSENLQCMFLLMGGRNPVDSEPCSPINYYIHWLLRDPGSLPNDNQRLEMAQDRHQYSTCGQLLCSRWMMMTMVQTCQNPVGFTMAKLWLTTGHALMDLLLMVTVYYSPTLLYRHPLNTGTHI